MFSKGTVALWRQSSVSNRCRGSWARTYVFTTNECNGNSVSAIVINATKDCPSMGTGFRRRCTERLEKLGDAAMDSRNYNEAAEHFSTVLSLNPMGRMDTFIKRSKARVSMNLWGDALSDADEVLLVLALYPTVFVNRVCRLSGSTHRLTEATSRGT